MKALALAALFVSFACLASAVDFAELAKAGVETARSNTLAVLGATEEVAQQTGFNSANDIVKSSDLVHSAVQVCREAVDGGIACCCVAANRVYEFADDRVLRCRATVAQCTHAACTAIDGVLDGLAAAAARKVVEAGRVVADKGLDLAVAGQEAVMGLGVGGLDLAQKGAHLALKGVDIAAEVSHLVPLVGVVVGTVGANYACYAGRELVNTFADKLVNLIDATDNALGVVRPEGHAHVE